MERERDTVERLFKEDLHRRNMEKERDRTEATEAQASMPPARSVVVPSPATAAMIAEQGAFLPLFFNYVHLSS